MKAYDFDQIYRDASSEKRTQLRLKAEDDPLWSSLEQEAISALYPQTWIYSLGRAGHLAVVTRQEDYFSIIDQFLREAETN